MLKNLTDRQSEIIEFIAVYIREHLTYPTVREVGEYFGWSSTNATIDHYKFLMAKGWMTLKYPAGNRVSYFFTDEARERLGLVFGSQSGKTVPIDFHNRTIGAWMHEVDVLRRKLRAKNKF